METGHYNNHSVTMGWADWMIVHQSLEEELELERTVLKLWRRAALKQLCVSLVRTNWHQAKLLKQAVGHIGQFDASMSC